MNSYNVLYIDQPVGSGYSYTNDSRGYATDLNQTTVSLYSALQVPFTFPTQLCLSCFVVSLTLRVKSLSYLILQTCHLYVHPCYPL